MIIVQDGNRDVESGRCTKERTECPERPGIVWLVSKVLLECGGDQWKRIGATEMRTLISSHLHRQIYRILVYLRIEWDFWSGGKSSRLKSEESWGDGMDRARLSHAKGEQKSPMATFYEWKLFRNSIRDPPGTCSRRLSLRRPTGPCISVS